MSNRPTAFIVDDDQGVRDAILYLLHSQNILAKGYSTAAELVRANRAAKPAPHFTYSRTRFMDFFVFNSNLINLNLQSAVDHATVSVINQIGKLCPCKV